MSMLYYIPAVLGVLFIAVGVYHGWKLRALTRHCTAATTGKLLGFEEKKMKSGSLYFPVVEFTVQNKTYKSKYKIGNAEWQSVAGDAVDVRYNPSNPDEIYLYHEQNIWQQYASPFFIIVGGFIFILAYYYVL